MRLIDADEYKAAICRGCNIMRSDEPCEPADCGVMAWVDAMPTISPDSLRTKGRWELQVKSFYMDNYDESIELAVYITASCSECGENHPKPHSSGQVYSHHIYAPEDADDDFRFDQDEEKAKLLDEFMGLLKSGKMRLVNFCPNCGAKMEV